MNDAPLNDREYRDLAYDLLKDWVLSEDEPEGELWDLYCSLNDVEDSAAFAEMVRYQRRQRVLRRKAKAA